MAAHLILYDGVCGLCNRVLQFLFRHDRRAVFRYSPLQGARGMAMVARWGGDPHDLTSFYVVADFDTPHARVLTKSDAAIFVAAELPWPWKAVRVGRALPKPIRDSFYNVIARTRYRVFGRYDTCPLPSGEFRNRFIE